MTETERCKPYCVYGNMDTRFPRKCWSCGGKEEGFNSMEEALSKLETGDNAGMPEEIVAWKHNTMNGEGRSWGEDEPCVYSDKAYSTVRQYRLKSTVDAERAADSKTIAALADILENLVVFSEDSDQIARDAEKALSDNKERIAEAQEVK